MIDPHKYDYLHAEGPNTGDFAEWEPRERCTCDACFLVSQIRYDAQGDFMWHWFEEDYKRLQKIMKDHPGFDRWNAFHLLISDGEDCIF